MKFPRVPSVPWTRPSEGREDIPPESASPETGLHEHDRPGFVFPLRDGSQVFVSPVIPDDRDRLEAGFEQLSDRSRFFRFFRERERLTEDEIRRLTEVDQVDHVAWCALDVRDPPFDGLGSGRMIRDPNDPGVAEVAVTVIDAAQRHGLGSVLLALLLLRARSLGISQFKAFVLPENEGVVGWLRNLGWSVIREEGFLEFAFETDASAQSKSASPTRERFDRLVDALRGPLNGCLASMASEPPPQPSNDDRPSESSVSEVD